MVCIQAKPRKSFQSLWLELLDHDVLQCCIPPDILVQENEEKPDGHFLHVHINQYRYVVREICDHRNLGLPRLSSEFLEHLLQAHYLGSRVLYGNLWLILYLLFPFLEIFPRYRIGGDQTYFEKKW